MRKPHISAKLRKAIADRAHGCCEYCISQASFSTQSFSVEHIIPYIKGGKTEPDNLALSCQGCNNHKHVRTEGTDPISSRIFHSIIQDSKDGTIISCGMTIVR